MELANKLDADDILYIFQPEIDRNGYFNSPLAGEPN